MPSNPVSERIAALAKDMRDAVDLGTFGSSTQDTRVFQWADRLEALLADLARDEGASAKEAFFAAYHAQWIKGDMRWIFDPLMKPGDPEHCWQAWLRSRALPVSPVSVEERPWPKRTPLAHIIAFCEQVARDGILPSQAWFQETADTLTQLAPVLGAEPPALVSKADVLALVREHLHHSWDDGHDCILQILGGLDPRDGTTPKVPLRSGGEALPPQTWQPIETAPKDGTWIVTVCEGWGHPGMCRWFNRGNEQGVWGYAGMEMRPTHWMPLPPSPPFSTTQEPWK